MTCIGLLFRLMYVLLIYSGLVAVCGVSGSIDIGLLNVVLLEVMLGHADASRNVNDIRHARDT